MPTVKHEFDFGRIETRPKQVTPEVIRAVCERIVDKVNPEKIVLFGSRAKGTASKYSDIDLLVIIDRKNPLALLKGRDRYGQILRLFPHRGFGLDVIVLTDEEVHNVINKNEGEWDLILEILNEGKTLYEQKA
ncbi:MAG: nucleotidyltransferase domain-containing protein [candidate division KSB1 bacterium]|nr:nucleotidyltransferase domain-containing protein [candidate division KSB1 bacterium]MDZ7300947.1 nucleotidyltransferase domain-containing protein [candidate division KSB1 bacterium]MDZ7310375.1 nucleotidyltransferase domain-containing protein [candidate division KSB1 bacterium]